MFRHIARASGKETYARKVARICGNDLVRYYKMEETSGTALIDFSSHTTNGTYVNLPTLDDIASPVVGGLNAPFFDGVDDRADLGTLSPLGNTADFMISTWLKVANAGVWTDGVQRTAVMIRNNTADWTQITRGTTDNQMRMECRAGSGSSNKFDINGISTTDWFHIGCVVKNSGDMEVYLDGISQGTVARVAAWAGSGGWLDGAIGRASDVNFRFWCGHLSNAVISDLDHSDADMLEIGTP